MHVIVLDGHLELFQTAHQLSAIHQSMSGRLAPDSGTIQHADVTRNSSISLTLPHDAQADPIDHRQQSITKRIENRAGGTTPETDPLHCQAVLKRTKPLGGRRDSLSHLQQDSLQQQFGPMCGCPHASIFTDQILHIRRQDLSIDQAGYMVRWQFRVQLPPLGTFPAQGRDGETTFLSTVSVATVITRPLW